MTKIRINRFIVFLPILLFVSCLRICFDSEKEDTRNAISIEEAKSIFSQTYKNLSSEPEDYVLNNIIETAGC